MIQMIMEEDPTDDTATQDNKTNFLSISPMIRETLENRRAHEIRAGRPTTVSAAMFNDHKS